MNNPTNQEAIQLNAVRLFSGGLGDKESGTQKNLDRDLFVLAKDWDDDSTISMAELAAYEELAEAAILCY